MSEKLPSLQNLRLAVLIDAENIPRNCIKRVMEEIAIYGTPTIKRIYGDWTSPVIGGWKGALLQNAITPIQQYSYTQGKNSSDSAMIIDAMDILYTEKTDGFVLVSSDSDFTRLAIRLREAGQRVIGIGERKTPNAFIAACDKFIYIEVINKRNKEQWPQNGNSAQNTQTAHNSAKTGNPAYTSDDANEADSQNGSQSKNGASSAATVQNAQADSSKDSAKTQKPRVSDEEIELIAGSISDLAGDSGSVFMGELGNLILKKKPDFDHRNFGFKSLSSLIKSIDRFEIEFRQTTDPNIKHVFVRDKENT